MVSVDEDYVVRWNAIERIETEFFVEDECISVCFLQCGDITLRFRIDGVEDRSRFFAKFQNFLRIEPLSNTNLDDHVWAEDLKRRVDNALEEAVHGGVA